MKAMKSMKAMKAMKAAGGMTATQAYESVAETVGLKNKDVKAVLEGMMALAGEQLKKTGVFKLGSALKMKIKKKPARAAKKGVNPFTKEPCVFKARPASKTVKVFPLAALKEMIN